MFLPCIFKLSLLLGGCFISLLPSFLSVLVVQTFCLLESNCPGAVYVSVNNILQAGRSFCFKGSDDTARKQVTLIVSPPI